MARATAATRGSGVSSAAKAKKNDDGAEPVPRRRSARVVKLEEEEGAEAEATDPDTEKQQDTQQNGKRGGGDANGAKSTKAVNGRKRRGATPVDDESEVKQEQQTPAAATRRTKRVKTEQHEDDDDVDMSAIKPETPDPKKKKKTKTASISNGTRSSKRGKVKPEPEDDSGEADEQEDTKPSPTKPDNASPSKADVLQARKLKSYSQYANKSPFPDFARPTADECKLAHKILASIHGPRERVKQEDLKAPSGRAGCGDSPSVLDALVRTILSQNTSDKNSTRAKLSMDDVYGGSDEWDKIAAGGEAKLQKAIQCGGLSQVKSRVIISILRQAKEKYGKYSLDHLFSATNDEAMTEMLAFQGVGPKTASCVLLFCLRRESFAVDTHVHRITGLLGWRPQGSSREEAHAHLDVKVPDEDKYGLHILLVTHGKVCDECKAGGRSTGKCELRRAFRGAKLKGEAGEDVKEEEEKALVKEEEEEDDDDGDEE